MLENEVPFSPCIYEYDRSSYLQPNADPPNADPMGLEPASIVYPPLPRKRERYQNLRLRRDTHERQ